MHDFFDEHLYDQHSLNNDHDPLHHDAHHTQDNLSTGAWNLPGEHDHQPSPLDIAHMLHLGPFEHLIDLIQHGLPFTGDSNIFLEQLGPIGHILELLQLHAPAETPHDTLSSIPQYEHFHSGVDTAGITGNPDADMAVWHYQMSPDTCAIVAQEFIIESLTGQHIDEETLRHEAELHGWYTPGGGTPTEHLGDLLEEFGLHVQREQGASLDELAARLNLQQKVIVGVNAEEIWYYGGPNDPLTAYPGIPGQQADHAVEVIGIDSRDPMHPLVILNDPGSPDGRGIEVPVDIFEQAWASSGNYLIATTDTPQPDPSSAPGNMLAGYSNADGTYHYDSDNTDRDPQTGAIIRRW